MISLIKQQENKQKEIGLKSEYIIDFTSATGMNLVV